MRFLKLVAIVGAVVLCSAQTMSPQELMSRHYPYQAARAGVEGVVVLCCTVLASGGVDCFVLSESPAGHGFGDASLSVARGMFRSSTLRPGAIVQTPLKWQLYPGERPGMDAVIREASGQCNAIGFVMGAPLN